VKVDFRESVFSGFPLLFCGILLNNLAIVKVHIFSVIFAGVGIFVAVGLIAFWLLWRHVGQGSKTRDMHHPTLDFQPVELYFGKTEDSPIVTFSTLSPRDLPPNSRPVDPSSKRLSELGPSLHAVASMLPPATLRSGNYMRVVVNGPLATANDGQSFLPFVRGADGRVSSLARLQDARQVARVTNAVMVWQVASVIVAQKYLADISAELDDIKKVMEGIKAFLEHERAAKITATLTYLEQLFQTITQGELPSGTRNEVESLEVKLIEVQDHLARDIGDLAEGIPRIEHSDWVGTSELADNIEKHQELMHGVQQLWVLCIRARAANWQILSAFPGEDHLKSVRMTQILGSIDKLIDSMPQIDKTMQDKIGEVDAFFNRQETLEERRNHLRGRHEEFQGEIISAVERARTQVSQVANRLSPGRTVLAVRTAQGKVVEAYELDES
jgi:hypothetical protein